MFKKFVSVCVCTAVLAANAIGGAAVAFADEASEATDSGPAKLRIGVSIANSTSAAGSPVKSMLDDAARELDIEINYCDHGNSPSLAAQAPDMLIDAGCSGLVVIDAADAALENALTVCEERGIYVAQVIDPTEALSTIDAADLEATDSTAETEEQSAYYIGAAESDPLQAFLMVYNALEGNYEDEDPKTLADLNLEELKKAAGMK